MLTSTIPSLLHSSRVTRVISRIKQPNTRLQDWFGLGLSPVRRTQIEGRSFSWDIFDKTRAIAKGRGPGSGYGRTALNPIGNVAGRVYRAMDSVHLDQELMSFTRPLGSQWGNVDARGASYLTHQEEYLGQLFKNNREFIVSRMFRGGFSLLPSGDDLIPVDKGTSGALFDVNLFGTDSSGSAYTGNLNQLDFGLGSDVIDDTWDDADTDIPKHLFGINAAFEQLHGWPLRDAWLNSTTWQYVINNTKIKNQAGSAFPVFESFAPSEYRNAEGIPDTGFEARLRNFPWLRWHIYDAGLNVNGTYTKYFPDGYVGFVAERGPWYELIEGSEIVAENVLDQGRKAYGFTSWATRTINPAGWDLVALDNCIPALYVPNCIAFADVVFTP